MQLVGLCIDKKQLMSWSIFNQSFYQSAYIQSLSCPPRYGLTPTSIWTLTCFKDKGKIEAPHQVHARAPSAKCEFHVDHQHPQVNWSIDPWLIGTPALFMMLFQTAIYYIKTVFCVGSCWINAGDPIFTSMTINWSISFNFHNLISRSYHAWSPFSHPTSVHTNQDQFAIKSSTL